jgi:diaminopimelate epimerase
VIKSFEKWHGCKNDFMIIWLTENEGDIVFDSIKRQASQFCSKSGDGVGADGILVLHHRLSSDPLPYAMTIINSDGSIASNCGNGLRVAALSIRRRHIELGKEAPMAVEIQVLERKFACQFYTGSNPYVAINMGQIKIDEELSWYTSEKPQIKAILNQIDFASADIHAAEIGNKHIVIRNISADQHNLLMVGPGLQTSEAWDGINVHIDEEIPLTKADLALSYQNIGFEISELHRVVCYERGVGETPACGSGACAVASAAWKTGFLGLGKWIGIQMPGGRLYCKKDHNSYTLAGPGEHVFDGKINI